MTDIIKEERIMVKIVVGGQLAKEELAAKIRAVGGDKVQVTVKDDLQGAMDIMAETLKKIGEIQ